MAFFVGHVLDQLAAHPDLINLISKNLSWGMLKQEASRPLTEAEDFDLMTLFKVTAKDSGIPEKELEIMLYMIVELTSSTCYSALLYSEPCSLEALKPHLFESVRSIVRQFLPDAAPRKMAPPTIPSQRYLTALLPPLPRKPHSMLLSAPLPVGRSGAVSFSVLLPSDVV